MAKKKAVAQKPRSRRGHPARAGTQQKIRELMFQAFELCDATGWWDEIWDTLRDEALGRGLRNVEDLFRLSNGANRHED